MSAICFLRNRPDIRHGIGFLAVEMPFLDHTGNTASDRTTGVRSLKGIQFIYIERECDDIDYSLKEKNTELRTCEIYNLASSEHNIYYPL